MYTQTYNDLKTLVEALAPDVEKANAGNKAAKVRVRQGLQRAKEHCTDFRKALQEPTTSNEQD